MLLFVCFLFSAAQPLLLRVLFVCEKAVNGDNYSKQNNALTTHNYATDANYVLVINDSLNN